MVMVVEVGVGIDEAEAEVAGGFEMEGERWEREEVGRWMPRDGRERDLRRVL